MRSSQHDAIYLIYFNLFFLSLQSLRVSWRFLESYGFERAYEDVRCPYL